MDTRKLDPLNQLDAATARLAPRLSAWWHRLESRSTLAAVFRRLAGVCGLIVFLAFVIWMVGGLLNLWPDGFGAYTLFALKAWAAGIVGLASMIWGLQD